MLFLVRVEVREVPPNQQGALLERVEQEWELVLRLRAQGAIKACGKLVRGRGAAAIFEVEDRAALDRALAALPLAPYFARIDVDALDPPEQALAVARRHRALWTQARMRAGASPAPPPSRAGGTTPVDTVARAGD